MPSSRPWGLCCLGDVLLVSHPYGVVFAVSGGCDELCDVAGDGVAGCGGIGDCLVVVRFNFGGLEQRRDGGVGIEDQLLVWRGYFGDPPGDGTVTRYC